MELPLRRRSLICHPAFISVFLALLLTPTMAEASFDEFSDDHSPTHFQLRARYLSLTVKGELELELHDLEGRGGPGYDSPTDTRTIGTRSPYVELDSFWLALRIGFPANIGVYSFVELTTDSARVGAVWLDYRGRGPNWLRHHVEVGYHTPIVAIDRRTERYPLIASAYWRQPELHASWEGRFIVSEGVELELEAAVAMMRPLDFTGVQESASSPGTINILSSGAARSFSGNGVVGGGRLRLTVFGAYVEGFGNIGRLAAEAGSDVLRSGFLNSPDVDGDESVSDDFLWFGGRFGYNGHDISAIIEGIASREGFIRRWGLYGQLSYAFHIRAASAVLFHTLETLVRYEVYRIRDSTKVDANGRALRSTAPINAVSWDYDVMTIAMIVGVYRDLVTFRLEASFIWEKNGVPELGIDDEPFRNNELLAQVELRF